jgi:hypothetical protein
MKIVFDFPNDAYDGVIACLSEYGYFEQVPNPEFTGAEGQEPMIPNPKTREQFAHSVVLDYISQRFQSWAERARLEAVQKQVKDAVKQRAEQVMAATTVTVEESV